MTRIAAFVGALMVAAGAAATEPAAGTRFPVDAAAEQQAVDQWRSARVAELTSDTGWLTLVGLFWLEKGDNTFGRARGNRLVLDHPALAPEAGTFRWDESGVHFTANRGSRITHGGQPVSRIDMVMDSQGEPTVVSSGPLRFFIIERSGKVGVRVRDVASARRRDFVPINYFPVLTDWVFDARFEPYEPHRHITIINILGLEQEMDCPGALVFSKDGQQYRLDAVLESPSDQTLFVMFGDRTNGKGSYGGGRFLHTPLPSRGTVRVDFNQAYNPPCAFNNFATCPLPPEQNKLTVRIEAGEKAYGNGHGGV
ncbi:MAG: DUF1684 domain-containing protein [Proteobacteria bacterium]|nr:DUF1684 domain-containing protein [Pseudomonadota bacterium]